MGKKLDALLGRRFRPTRLRPLLNLALSRLAVLKSQRQARGSLARSDVVHLLGLAQHDRALLRVEQVIKEQNMIDALAMIEMKSQLEKQISDDVEEELNGSVGDVKRKYKDVADAAQAAFQSAANAAAAAKAAVELSRYRPPDTDNHDTGDLQRKEDWKNKEINALSLKARELDVLGAKTLSHTKEALEDDVISSAAQEEYLEGRGSPLPYSSHQEDLPSLPDGVEESELKNPVTHSAKGLWKQKVQGTDDKKGRVSVRTRR